MRQRRYIVVCAIGLLTAGFILHRMAVISPVHAQADDWSEWATRTHPTFTKAMADQEMMELSNWGRWGKDDQLGTINLITPAKRRQALSLPKEGVSFSMARDVLVAKSDGAPGAVLKLDFDLPVASDRISYLSHSNTHLDALCHYLYNGKMYNGYSQNEATPTGCDKNSIVNIKGGIITRGILMDIPRLKGVDHLAPGTHIYPEDLDAWEKKAHIKVSSGDAVFIRTGVQNLGAGAARLAAPGLDPDTARWFKARDIALLGSDSGSGAMPPGVFNPKIIQPIHALVIIAMGTPIFDGCDLELLSREANRRQRWDFLLTAAPNAIPGATASQINPIATF